MTNLCVWCEKPGTLSDSHPLTVDSFDTGESIETVYYHADCASFWGTCIFCHGLASKERPTLATNTDFKALRFSYHQDCGENRVKTLYPWMFQNNTAFRGRSLAQADPNSATEMVKLIGEGIRIRQRSWMRLPEEAVR